jgi:LacI family transcriptional regulator
VQRTAGDSDLHVVLVDTGEHPDEEVRAVRTLARDVDGFIVLSPRRLHLELDALGTKPAVFVNRPVRGRASLLLRTAPAVVDVLAHLASFGHGTLAYLGGPPGSWAAGERLRAVRQSSKVSALGLQEMAVGGPTFDDAEAVVGDIVRKGVSAVMAFNDQMALGVMAGLARLGLSVPADVSVVGIDDVPMAAMVAPPLTTIALPTQEAGVIAVRKLGEEVGTTELFGSLVLRDSTGPAPAPAGAAR